MLHSTSKNPRTHPKRPLELLRKNHPPKREFTQEQLLSLKLSGSFWFSLKESILEAMLGTSSRLVCLELDHVPRLHESIQGLCRALKDNRALRELRIGGYPCGFSASDNSSAPDMWRFLVPLLQCVASLPSMEHDHAATLSGCQSLQLLEMELNCIGNPVDEEPDNTHGINLTDSKSFQLANAIRRLSTLKRLKLCLKGVFL